MTEPGLVAVDRHPIDDPAYAEECRARLDRNGALVLEGFLTAAALEAVLADVDGREAEAFFTTDTHNVFLTPPDPSVAPDHIVNRQIVSSKGCLADDQIADASLLRRLYESPQLRRFLCRTLGVDSLHPYHDDLSSINVHYHRDGQELGWHFDNSSFAVTLLIQQPRAGGRFEYVADLRDADAVEEPPDLAGIEAVLDDGAGVRVLEFAPGDLVIFRGRNSMHRVTPSRGDRTRILAVLAFNTEPGIGLSAQAQETFYGRTG